MPSIAVAAVRVAGVREEADKRLVELHALRVFRAVGRYRALRTLRRDRARAVGEQQADERLESEQVVAARVEAEQRGEGDLGEAGVRSRMSAVAMPQKLSGFVLSARHRCADQRAEQVHPPRQAFGREPRDALAHQRPPRERGRDRGQHRVGGRVARRGLQVARRKPTSRRALAGPRASPAARRIARVGEEAARGRSRRCAPMSKSSSSALAQAGRARSDRSCASRRLARRALAARPDDARGRRQHAVGRVAGLARGLRRRECQASPCRLTIRADRDVDRASASFSPPGSCSSARLTLASSGYCRRVEHRYAVQAA